MMTARTLVCCWTRKLALTRLALVQTHRNSRAPSPPHSSNLLLPTPLHPTPPPSPPSSHSAPSRRFRQKSRLDASDFQALRLSLFAARGHIASLLTLRLEAINVSFVHDFPGPVESEIAGDMGGVPAVGMKGFFSAFGRWIYIPGERHLFLATSERYASRSAEDNGRGDGDGVQVGDEVDVARRADGESGSGVYSAGWDGESAAPKVEKLLARMRKDGTLGEFTRITG